MRIFSPSDLKNLYHPNKNSTNEENGQVTIIGGSRLFHGPPLFSIKASSRIVDMVFFASPHDPLRDVAANLKSQIGSFIWVPFEEVEEYIAKSDAVLIGPGFMRAHTEKANQDENGKDGDYRFSRGITQRLLKKFPNKKWVIDAGSLQTMDPQWIPENSILTPNKKEYKMLFGNMAPDESAKKYKCTIVIKGPTTYVYSPDETIEVHGGNPGLTKGGTGDTLSGLTVGLLAKNEPLLAATAGAYVTKAAGDALYKKQGVYFNADDLAEEIPRMLFKLIDRK